MRLLHRIRRIFTTNRNYSRSARNLEAESEKQEDIYKRAKILKKAGDHYFRAHEFKKADKVYDKVYEIMLIETVRIVGETPWQGNFVPILEETTRPILASISKAQDRLKYVQRFSQRKAYYLTGEVK